MTPNSSAICWTVKERAKEPHRGQLQREPKTVRIPSPLRYQLPILIIEEEEPLKLLRRRRDVETATDRQLLRGQEALLMYNHQR